MGVTISLLVLIFVFVYFLAMAIAAIYVYKDAKKRDMSAGGWALIVFFGPLLLGLIIYLISRKPVVDFQCPSCGAGLPAYAKECPKCGHSMLTQCPQCEFPVQRGWKTCPKCATVLPENFEQPVRAYKKDNSGFVVVGIIVGLLIVLLLWVGGSYVLFRSDGDMYYSENYSGIEGLYNLNKEDFVENETITTWIEKSDESKKKVHVLLSKESSTCLVYVKDSDDLLNSSMDLEYFNDETCNVVLFIDDSGYEDLYGYDFFLYEFDMFDDTDVEVCYNVGDTDVEVTFTDKDISMSTWGGNSDERE